MEGLILGGVVLVAGMLIMGLSKHWTLKYLGAMWIVASAVLLVLGTWEVTALRHNMPLHPAQISTSDTVYVTPKHGIQGVALIVKTDSTGQHVEARPFIARHVIEPSIK